MLEILVLFCQGMEKQLHFLKIINLTQNKNKKESVKLGELFQWEELMED